jgi:hypothetical protein
VLVTFMVKLVGAVDPGAVATVPVSRARGSETLVAPTVAVPAWVPKTSTVSPTTILDKDGELVPGWSRVVEAETSTVTRVVAELPGLVTLKVKVAGAVDPGAVTTVPVSLVRGSVTVVASTVSVPGSMPETFTVSPATMLDSDGELVPGWSSVVEVETSTVTRVVAELPGLVTFMVKVVGAVDPGAVTTVPETGARPWRVCKVPPPGPPPPGPPQPGPPRPPCPKLGVGAAPAAAAPSSDMTAARHKTSPPRRKNTDDLNSRDVFGGRSFRNIPPPSKSAVTSNGA